MKTMLFIDGGYLYKALQNLYRDAKLPIIDFKKLVDATITAGKDELIRIYYYNAYPPIYSDQDKQDKIMKLLWQIDEKKRKLISEGKDPAQERYKTTEEEKAEKTFENGKKQMRFYDTLRTKGIDVKLVKLKRNPEGSGEYRQKGVDVYIASDMLGLAYRNAYDKAILLSGDVDFVKVIEEIKSLGKIVHAAFYQYGKSFDLLKSCDAHIELDANKSFLVFRD